MLKVITADLIDEPVKRFLSGLDISSEASVVEVNGRRVYLMARPANEPTDPETNWTEAQSKRRHHLIDLKLGNAISAVEVLELAQLSEEFERHRNRVAPLPMSYAIELLAKLTAEAGTKS